MFPGLTTKNFFPEEKQVVFAKKSDNGVYMYCKTIFLSDTLIEYQKDIVNDFIGNIIETIDQKEDRNLNDLKKEFELALQNLNENLENFSFKASDVGYFPIKGICWIIYQDTLMVSLIGDVSFMVIRENKFHYIQSNDASTTKIDIFSDFIEGELDEEDQFIFIGTNYKNIIHKQDLKNIENILTENEMNIMDILYDILHTRVPDVDVACILWFQYGLINNTNTRYTKKRYYAKAYNVLSSSVQNFLYKNKYTAVSIILGCIIVILGYNIIMEIFTKQVDVPVIETEQGIEPVTINSIKKDIYEFENLEITSPEKTKKYKQIIEKITFLESQNKRPEDTVALKKLIQNKYDQGFKIVYLNTNDLELGTTIKPIYIFSQQEQNTLGRPVNVFYKDTYFVGGESGSIIGAVNDTIRGTPIVYNMESNVKGCSFDLSKQGLYCFTDTNQIIRVSKGGVQMVKIEKKQTTTNETNEQENIPFDNPIVDIAVFAKNNFYVLHTNHGENIQGKYVTRYINIQGKYDVFQPGLQYKIIGQSGKNLGFTSMGIDKTFLLRSSTEKKLYQMRRDVTVNMRPIILQGGEEANDAYSSSVKVITLETSKYVYLFDKEKQTLTVYKSSPLKTNEKFQYNYNLIYVFKYKFDFPAAPVIDVTIPTEMGDRPYLYFLTKNGIYQINLTEFIKQYDK